jgi:NADH dehydrogenase
MIWMSNILVVGGGFAGVWSAAAAVRLARACGAAGSELTVTLIAGGDDLVIKPRLYQSEPEKMRVPLDRVLGPIGVRRHAGTVTDIDTASRRVSAIERDGRHLELDYDRLVLATGSQLVRPDLPGAQYLHDVDTLPAAAALDAHLRRLPSRPTGEGQFTAVVVGAGFTGLEVATELVERLRALASPVGAAQRVRVILVDRADVVGVELGPGPRDEIVRALSALAVEQRLGVSVRSIRPAGVTLSDGSELAASTVVWTAGVLASPLTATIPANRDHLGRLEVDEYLRVVGVPEVYAAGDTAAATAEQGHRVTQSCQHAGPQGRFAGHNVAAGLLGLPQQRFAPDPYVTCLDLGAAGAVFTTGWERTPELTEQAAKERKRQVNEVWIYPPVDDGDEILRRADFRVPTRRPFAPTA